MLTLELRNSPHGPVLCCSGRIVHGDGADTLLRAVMSQDKRHIQLDLSAVKAIDAGGLGVLASLEQWARDTNRTIQLINPSQQVREALEATHLSSVLRVCSVVRDCTRAS